MDDKIVNLKFSKERLLWICLTTILVVIILISLFNGFSNKRKFTIAKLNEKILIAQNDTLKTSLRHYREVLQYQPNTLSDKEIDDLKKKGLQNPITDLVSDLMGRKELIPYKGVLGGTMIFFNAHILTPKQVFAYFEDGHIGGYMLLEYQLSDGKISWTVLDSYLL
ncbi:MAG: hypothetical protein Q8O10_00320 [candidate division Zixibacteria bacterium]|nr:hypothetical protein [candidate division Zixibacteria bacterium]